MDRHHRQPDRKVCSQVRVRYAETDKMGVVYYANYLIWFEVGRTEWLRQSGFTYRELEESGIVLPVIEVRCQYQQPAHYDDDIEIRTQGTLLSGVRVQFDYEVARRGAAVVFAVGQTVHASVDPGGRPKRLPLDIRQLFGLPERPAAPDRVVTAPRGDSV